MAKKIPLVRIEDSYSHRIYGRDTACVTIRVRILGLDYSVAYVPENILRCALGSEDLDYLMGRQVSESYVEGESDDEDLYTTPGRDESQCFSLSPSEFKDCLRHGELVCHYQNRG